MTKQQNPSRTILQRRVEKKGEVDREKDGKKISRNGQVNC